METSSPNFIKNDQLRLQKFYNDNLDHPAKPRWPLDEKAPFSKGAGVSL